MSKVDQRPTLLGDLVADARADLVRAGGCPLDAYTWRQAIGERIASRSSPEQLRDGVLTLRVASPVWAQELSLLSATIIERLAPLGFDVRTIRCKVGNFGAHVPTRKPSHPPAAPRQVALPPDLLQQLAKVDDEAMRSTIEATARAQLQLREQRQRRTVEHNTKRGRR